MDEKSTSHIPQPQSYLSMYISVDLSCFLLSSVKTLFHGKNVKNQVCSAFSYFWLEETPWLI